MLLLLMCVALGTGSFRKWLINYMAKRFLAAEERMDMDAPVVTASVIKH